MSEQSPNQSSIDVFVERAKARLDEMAADAKLLESRLDTFDASLPADAIRKRGLTGVGSGLSLGPAL